MKNPENSSILTVLRGFFQDDKAAPEQIQKLTKNELEELQDRVLEFSDAYEPTKRPEAIYPGSWIAGNWHLRAIREKLNQSVLYHKAIVTHDPLADYFGIQKRWLPELRPIRYSDGTVVTSGPRLWNSELSFDTMKHDLDGARGFLASLIPHIFELGPLLDEGIILPLPQWKVLKERKEALVTSVRHDVKNDDMVSGAPYISEEIGPLPMWDNLNGFHATMNQPIVRADQRWEWQYEFFQLAKQVAFADRYQTIYVPQSAAEMELLKLKVGQLAQQQETAPRSETLSEISRFVLPDLQLSTSTAISIRRDEDSFKNWQEIIRNIDRDSAGDTKNELKQRIEDSLAPIYRDIRKLSRRDSIKRLTTKESLQMVFIAAGGSLVSGSTPAQAAASGVVGWLANMFLDSKAEGAARVLNSLQKDSRSK